MNRVVLELGSNIDPEKNISRARELIGEVLRIIKSSRVLRTKAQDMDGAPDFLNGALSVETHMDLSTLKIHLREIETKLGRDPVKRSGSRTIDIDIISFNSQVINEDFQRYDFVRETVCEVAPELS